ncbi:MAG: hypothetical protein M5U12_00475 [Verrucomicrobia bacterium]|nr:hypothetical protein [Verrucomicrobiota bacterium]
MARPSAVEPDGQWHEFVLGLLGAGEVLLDDLSVIESPDFQHVAMLQNGTFTQGTPGGPNSSRIPNPGPTFARLRHDPPVPAPAAPGSYLAQLSGRPAHRCGSRAGGSSQPALLSRSRITLKPGFRPGIPYSAETATDCRRRREEAKGAQAPT